MSRYFEIILPKRNKNAHRIIGYTNTDGCWLCTTLCKDCDGYVKIHINGEDTRLHRALYKEFIGLASEDLFVLHSCDNPACCNPNHLEAGTAAENNRAKILRGRQGNTGHRLSDLDKNDICQSKKSNTELARIYNVSRATIRNTKRKFKESLKDRLEPNKPSIPNKSRANRKVLSRK